MPDSLRCGSGPVLQNDFDRLSMQPILYISRGVRL